MAADLHPTGADDRAVGVAAAGDGHADVVAMDPSGIRPRTLQVPDGRTLAWYEFGDPDGLACVYAVGTPASGVGAGGHHNAAVRAGVRLICPDRPGYGDSDRQLGRRLSDWVDDMRMLADHLDLDRFVVLGESGGGPHALALGHGMPDRVASVAVVAGMGPVDDTDVLKGMTPGNRRMVHLARRAPLALWPMVALMRWHVLEPGRAARHLASVIARMPGPDQDAFSRHGGVSAWAQVAVRRALQPGAGGTIDELRMIAEPWGFRLDEVVVPVHLWHGTADRNVPVGIGLRVGAALPDCRARILDGAGHLLLLDAMDEVLTALTQHATDATSTTDMPESTL